MTIENEFIPLEINIDDGLFKIAIKKFINNENIDIESFKDKFENEHEFHNLINNLHQPVSMTDKQFRKWCNLLDVTYNLKLEKK